MLVHIIEHMCRFHISVTGQYQPIISANGYISLALVIKTPTT